LPPLLLLLLPSSATTEYAYGSTTDSPTAQPFSTAVRRWLVATAGAATAWPPAHVARRPWAVTGHAKTFYGCALSPRLHNASPWPQTSSTAVGTGWSPTCPAAVLRKKKMDHAHE